MNRGSGEVNVVRPQENRVCGIGDDGAVETEQAEEEEEAGLRRTKKLGDPVRPKEEEVREHERTHLPFRSWCKHCVRGRGKEMPHQKTKEKGEMVEVHMDFMFVGDEEETRNTATILVLKERHTGMVMSTVVPNKTTGRFVTDRSVAFLEEVGALHGDIIMKSDQEPAILAIADAVARRKAEKGSGRAVMEHSPVKSSASNGVVERAIQSVQMQIRVMKSALEERWGCKLSTHHPVVAWLAEYAGHLLNRFEVGRDGRTAYERSKMKPAKTLGLEMGEAVLWKRKPVGGALGKLTCMWDDGIFLGVKGKTGEVIVGDKKGVWKTRTVQRKPASERCSIDNADMIIGLPWNVRPRG